MYRHLFLALLMTLGFLLGGCHVAQATSFTFIPIDVPGAVSTQPFRINWRSQIVGRYDDSKGTHGFLYNGGAFTTLNVPFPGAESTTAYGINSRGQIVGVYFDANFREQGFLATP